MKNEYKQIEILSRKDVSFVFLKSKKQIIYKMVQHMQDQGTINKLTLLFDLNIPLENKYINKVNKLKKIIKHNNSFFNFIEHIILIFDHEKSKIYKYSLPNFTQKKTQILDSSGHRKYKLEYFEDLYSRFSDLQSNFFNHRFLEYNSSYIPAFGTEFKVKPDYIEAGFGRGKTNKSSKTLSTIEAFERYINMYDRNNTNTLKKSFNNMDKKNTLDPKTLILHSNKEYSDKNFKLKKYTDDLNIEWVLAKNQMDKSKIFVPKNSVWFGEKKRNESINNYVFETSNGMAIGGTYDEACLYGLYELIERDSFLKAWYGKTLVPEVDWSGTGLTDFEALQILLSKKKQYIHVFDITSNIGIPTYWAMLKSEDPNCPMAVYNAAGCNLNPKKAIEAALYEIITSFPIYEKILIKNQKLAKRAKYVQKDINRVTEFQDHVLFYSSFKNASKMNYLLNNKKIKINQRKVKIFKNTSEELDIVKSTLDKLNYLMLSIDVTPKFLKNEGLIGVKSIVPGLLPMTFGNQYRRISKKLLVDYNKKFNQKLDVINPLPHPFP